MNGESTSTPDDDPLGPVVESFLARFRRGERPALTDLIARHPEMAGRIRELIPALVELEQLGRSTGDSIPSPGHRTGSRGSWDEGPSPERLGDYVIRRRIGGGGMGVVYEAERESLKSRVALKVMHPRFRADPQYLRRFHAEARLAAGLHHTNIVGVFDYGEQDGVCYYAMQFIQGEPLDHVLADLRRLRDDGTCADGLRGSDAILTIPAGDVLLASSAALRGLLTGRFAAATAIGETVDATDAIGACEPEPAGSHGAVAGVAEPSALGSSSLGGSGELRYFREIARVGAQVADALEYAHRRGVLHRDIKPSNLLLDALGNVWVTDFGLAKLEEGEDLSQSHEVVGTLRYMAPERFRRTSDRRGDIYSLGATLYELLALRPPFAESDQIRLMEQIRNDFPAPPRQVDRHIPRDLETIVLKALAKDPADRFGTAGELAEELRRFVEGRPIRSRPVSVVERFWRWCKRDPWLAGANVAAALLTTVLAIVAIVYRNQAEALQAERGRSAEAVLDARRGAVDAYTSQARGGRFSHRPGQRFDSLEAVKQAARLLDGLPPGPDTASRREELRDLAIAAMALPDLQPTGRVIARPPGVIAAAFDPAMDRYALRFRDGRISVRRVADHQEIAHFQARGDRDAFILTFSPDGRYLATEDVPSRALTVWDVDRQSVVVRGPRKIWWQVSFSPDSRRMLAAGGNLLEYDLETGRLAREWPGQLSHAVFRPDGAQIAVVDNGTRPPTCRILQSESGQLVRKFSIDSRVDYVAWSPDGRTLATAHAAPDIRIVLWDTETGTRRATLEGHSNGGLSVSFHPDGTLLASNDFNSRLRLWDPIQGRPLLSVTGGWWPEFSRDGRIVISNEDKLTIYEVDPAREYRTFARASGESNDYRDASVRHDGRLLAVGTSQGVVLWDLAHGTELGFLSIGTSWHLLFEPSGDLLTNDSLGVQRWPIQLDAGRGELRIGPPRRLPLPAGNHGIAADRSGRIVAKANHTHALVATPERTLRVEPLNDCRGLAVSPDGQWLATGTHLGPGAQVWRIPDLTKAADLSLDSGTTVAFSPDGKWLMTGAAPCRLWEVGTWRERRIGGSGGGFSPDGRLVVVQEASKVIRLVETETGRTLARLESPDLCENWGPFISPDGSRLVVSTLEGPAVHVWDLRAIRKRLRTMGLDWEAPAYSENDPAAPSEPRFARVQIDDLKHMNAEASALAEEGRWEEAAAVYARAGAEGLLDQPNIWLNHAILRLAVGDVEGYRRSGQHMLQVFGVIEAEKRPGGGHTDRALRWLECTAHVLALAPVGPAETAQAMRIASRSAEVFHSSWAEQVLGLALYRDGRFAEADTRLRSFLDRDPKRDYHVLDWLVLAMVDQRLGRLDEARRWLGRAESWAASRRRGRPGGDDRAIPDHWHWSDGVLLHLLLREARALIGANLPMLPEDVFAPAT
jgi:eukaryotic-like serine/threonine-protein kinase